MVFDEVAHELAYVAELLDLEVVLAEEPVEVSGHQARLLKGRGPAVHHSEVLDVV